VDDWLTTNQRMWDERVPLHVGSSFYDVEGFKSGKPILLPFEVEELGPLDGLNMVHLQCHFGLETLDIARLHPTAKVTGDDFSVPAIEAAAQLAGEVRLATRARFVVADVYRAAEVLGHERFDVVYTGKGALLWLPDLDRWAEVVRDLLTPGGFLYLTEFHPVADVLADDEPVPERDYFATEPFVYDEPGSYVDPTAPTEHNVSYEWQHPLGRVITALLGAGFQLELFHEHDFTVDNRHKFLAKAPDRGRRWPPGGGTLPLMYSLKAIRPW
jgi:SAM-dependent methyltransferase